MLGYRLAKEFKLPLKEFPADWERFGKSAGYIRNEQMANIFRMLYDYKFPNFKFRVCPQRAFIGFTFDDLFIEFEKDGNESLSKQ